MVALLGTNGAGKSTLLRAVSGLSHPHRGVVRLFGMNSTYLEPEQIIDEGVALLVGGKMTFSGPQRARQPPHRGPHAAQGPGQGEEGARRGAGGVPRAGGPAGPAGRHALGRGAADARPVAGDDDEPAPPHDRRAGPRAGPHDGGAPDGDGAAHQRLGHHGDPGGAEPEPRARAWPSAASSWSGARSASTGRRPSSWRATTCCAPSSSAPPPPGSRSVRARVLGSELRPRPRRLLRAGLRDAGARPGPRLPHQPGPQLRPGPDRRHCGGVPGQADGGLPLQLLVRPGAVHRPGRARSAPCPSSCCAGSSAAHASW